MTENISIASFFVVPQAADLIWLYMKPFYEDQMSSLVLIKDVNMFFDFISTD